MGRRKDLSPRKKGQLRVLLEETYLTQVEVARKLGTSPQAVSVYAKRIKEGISTSPKRISVCGRKKLSTERADRKLVQMCLRDRRATSENLRRQWQECGVAASSRTVRRRLWDSGLKSCIPRKKPLLTTAMMRRRLDWARRYRSWTSADWCKVVFSDESTLQILDDRTSAVRRRVGEAYHPACVVRTVKHPQSIMVWGSMSVHGLGRLHIVEGTMRQDQYIKVLENKLIPQLQDWGRSLNGVQLIFQQDNAPCHTARSVKTFMDANHIKLLDWPGNSPDLNPIEHMWKLLKDKMNKCSTSSSKRELTERLLHTWFHDEDLRQTAIRLIEGMPRRLEAVIAARGGSVKY